jgi:transposase
MRRHEISDESWDRIKDMLPGRPGQQGWIAKDNRLFINAVLWIGKTGAPWRDLPERFGLWNSVWKRFDRWSYKGVWLKIFDTLAAADPDLEWLILDSTVIRAHQHAAGKKGGKRRRLLAAPQAASAPRSMPPSTPLATQSGSS